MPSSSLSNILKIMSFSMACIMSASVMGFSIYQLTTDISDSQQLVWISLLSSTFTLWVPSPSTIIQFKQNPNDYYKKTDIEVQPNNVLAKNNSRIIEEV